MHTPLARLKYSLDDLTSPYLLAVASDLGTARRSPVNNTRLAAPFATQINQVDRTLPSRSLTTIWWSRMPHAFVHHGSDLFFCDDREVPSANEESVARGYDNQLRP